MVICLFLAGLGTVWAEPAEKARIGAARRRLPANAVLQHKSVVFACFKWNKPPKAFC